MLRIDLPRSSFALVCSSLVLVAPVAAASRTYTVSAGDTLTSIAAHEGVSQGQLERLNHFADPNALSIGQVLIVTNTEVTHPKSKTHAITPSSKHHRQLVAMRRSSRHHTSSHRIATKPNSSSVIAQRQALWIAMHSGFAVPDLALAGMPSFGSAQRLLALELRLTKTALRYLGVPYSWGGESFSGVDCSGFVQAVFRHNGIELPRTADAQFEVGRHVPGRSLEPGDLVFFQTYTEGASHVGIYLGGGQFVHASSSNGVRVDSMSESYYSSRFIGARRAAEI